MVLFHPVNAIVNLPQPTQFGYGRPDIVPQRTRLIPSTFGEDGDPLDVLVLMDEPAHVGCLLDVRMVGVIQADQTQQDGKAEINSRLLAVAIHSRSHENNTSFDRKNA